MLLESFPNLANYGTYEANVKRNMIWIWSNTYENWWKHNIDHLEYMKNLFPLVWQLSEDLRQVWQ